MHDADIVRLLLELLLILVSAKLFGEGAERLGQPAVMGELLGGVFLGSGLFAFFEPNDPVLAVFSEIGVLLLLFETGLNSDLPRLLQSGPRALAVATTGVVAPFALGWGLMTALGRGGLEAVFIGATLTATSVGISARVLADMGRLAAQEAQLILGAAMVDDVLGLVILAAVQAAALGGSAWSAAGRATVLSLAFLGAALWIGPRVASRLVVIARRMRVRGILVLSAIGFAFVMALASRWLGGALIVGAFTAGLLLARTEAGADMDREVRPVADLFVPVFFVMAGAKVDLGNFWAIVPGNQAVLWLTLALIAAAVAGKLLSGLAAPAPLRRLAIGAGMLPRGEVGLIFAQVGLAAGVLDQALYGAVVAMVLATTFLAPPLLKRSLS